MLVFVVFLHFGCLIGVVSGQEWVSETNGNIPAYPFYAGYDDGRSLYICKDYFHGEPVVGKISYNQRSCKVPWGEKENNDYSYQVLTRPPWADYTLEWKGLYSWGNVPSDAVCIGSGVYVGRYKRSGRYYVPGKVIPKHWSMFYGYNGKEYQARRRYEVLVKKARGISHYELTKVEYDFSQAEEIISPDSKQVATAQQVTNDSPYTVTTSVSLEVKKTVTRSWSEMTEMGIEIGNKLTVKVGVPILGEITNEFHVTTTHTYQHKYGESTTQTHNTFHAVSVTMGPNSTASVMMVAKEARLRIPYTGRLTVYFKNNQYYSRSVSGTFDDIHMTSVETRIDDEISAD